MAYITKEQKQDAFAALEYKERKKSAKETLDALKAKAMSPDWCFCREAYKKTAGPRKSKSD